MPAGLQGKTIDDVEVGAPLGRSWILLGGLIPVDFDDLRLVELEPGRRFLERSRTLTFSLWQHERVVEPEGEGSCRVTDRLGFELRPALAWLPGLSQLARTIVAALFRHRHRRLARHHSEVRRDPHGVADGGNKIAIADEPRATARPEEPQSS